jgi:hypothetical protein
MCPWTLVPGAIKWMRITYFTSRQLTHLTSLQSTRSRKMSSRNAQWFPFAWQVSFNKM